MTYKTTKKQIKTKLTTRTSLFGLAVIVTAISLVSVDGITSDGQSSFVAMAQTALWQLGDNGNIYYNGGNVGIGTENPPYPLAIEKTDTYGTMFGIGHATTDNLYFGASHEANRQGDPTMYGEPRYFAYMNTGIDNSDASAIVLNHVGYLEGTDYFRDTIIADGKKEAIATFDGSSKNVGIGTTSPNSKLEIRSANTDNAPLLRLENEWNDYRSKALIRIGAADSGDNWMDIGYHRGSDDAQKGLVVNNGDGDEVMRIQHHGNVGIGIINPSETLEIDGNVKTEKVKAVEYCDKNGDNCYTINELADTNSQNNTYSKKTEWTTITYFETPPIIAQCDPGDMILSGGWETDFRETGVPYIITNKPTELNDEQQGWIIEGIWSNGRGGNVKVVAHCLDLTP